MSHEVLAQTRTLIALPLSALGYLHCGHRHYIKEHCSRKACTDRLAKTEAFNETESEVAQKEKR